MKHYFTICLSLVFLLLLGSCHKENDIVTPLEQEFIATLPSSLTKSTVTADGKVAWESTDAIGIFDENVAAPVKATIKSISTDGKTAVFTPASDITSAVGAIYPYDANATMADNSTISVVIKSPQSGSFADANIAAAKADGFNLAFKNVTAVFKFNVSDENAKSVRITAPKVAGTLGISLGAAITAALEETDATDEITVSNITKDKDYYVAIAPKQYADISYSWYDNDGKQLSTASLGKAITVVASNLYTWGNLKDHEDFIVFENENFEAYCVENFDKNKDGKISFIEALDVKEISICPLDKAKYEERFKDIDNIQYDPNDCFNLESIQELKYFKNLESLDCSAPVLRPYFSDDYYPEGVYYDSYGSLSSLDVSENSKLIRISCNGNPLSELDLTNNPDLEELNAYYCNFSSINIAQNGKLRKLYLSGNHLKSLDLSYNPLLSWLSVYHNDLQNIDLSHNPELDYLWLGDNPNLAVIDLANNTKVTQLDIAYTAISTIDLSPVPDLTLIYANKCPNLTAFDLSSNQKLTFIHIGDTPGQKNIDVSSLVNLTELYVYNCGLTELDVSNNSKLIRLDCYNNPISTLNVSNNIYLKDLRCSHCELGALDISKNSELNKLSCANNNISYIYVWKGFDKYTDTNFIKDDTTMYVEIGDSAGNIEDYTITDPWD